VAAYCRLAANRSCKNIDFGIKNIKTQRTCFLYFNKNVRNRMKTCPTSVVLLAV